jgi:hypothetical protein
MPPTSPGPVVPHRLLALAATVAAIVLLAAIPATGAPALSDGGDAIAHSAATGTCTALIRNSKGRYVPVYTSTYKYRFKKVQGSKFKRVIVRVRVKARVSCAKRCVLQVKKRGKLRSVYTYKRLKVKVKRGSRIVTVTQRKRVYRYTTCPAGTGQVDGVPVKITVKPGSSATLDFGAFQREAPITGTLKGFVPGTINLKADIQVQLTGGSLALGQTPVFIDDDCDGQVSAAIRTGRDTTIALDPARTSTATLLTSGTATSTAYTVIRLPLELRNGDVGCNKPYLSTGYREFKQTFFLRGRLGAGGLSNLTLTSAPAPIDVEACLAPGAPTQPCNGFAIPLPIIVSTKLVVALDLSGKP